MEQVIEILKLAWYGHEIEGLIRLEPVTTALAISAGAQLLSGLFGGIGANNRAKRAAKEKRRLTKELEALEKSRQTIINPYAGMQDFSSMVEDLSSKMTNPFDSLGVATQAAEIQMEQTDIALANTLDTLRATGAGAGGATALAQAALASKKGVAANIEQQEARNEQLRAEGEATLEANRLAEKRRIQSVKLGQAEKLEQGRTQGAAFVYGEKERRETEQLNRKQAQITGQAQVQAQARADAAAITGSTISGLADTTSSYAMYKASQ